MAELAQRANGLGRHRHGADCVGRGLMDLDPPFRGRRPSGPRLPAAGRSISNCRVKMRLPFERSAEACCFLQASCSSKHWRGSFDRSPRLIRRKSSPWRGQCVHGGHLHGSPSNGFKHLPLGRRYCTGFSSSVGGQTTLSCRSKNRLITVRDRAPPECLEYIVDLPARGVSHRRSFRYTAHCLSSRDLF